MIERHRVREIARHAAAHGRIDAQFPSASAQQRFDLRVAFEALRHARHFLPDALRAPEIPVATQVVVRLPELLPALDKAVGALERIGAQFCFLVHRTHRGLTSTLCGLVDQLWLALEGVS